MTKKIKVVDIADNEAVAETPIVETPIVETPTVGTPVIEEPEIDEAMPPSEKVENTEVPTQLLKQPVAARYITCEFCNKNMQMKTYKY